MKICFGHDVVAVVHRSGLVARNFHGNRIRYTGTRKISDGGSSEVMKRNPIQASQFYGCSEGSLDAFDRLPSVGDWRQLEVPINDN